MGFLCGIFVGLKIMDRILEKLPFFKGVDSAVRFPEQYALMIEKTYDICMKNRSGWQDHEKSFDVLARISSSQEKIAWILENMHKRFA